jgi:hypothetical protein
LTLLLLLLVVPTLRRRRRRDWAHVCQYELFGCVRIGSSIQTNTECLYVNSFMPYLSVLICIGLYLYVLVCIVFYYMCVLFCIETQYRLIQSICILILSCCICLYLSVLVCIYMYRTQLDVCIDLY